MNKAYIKKESELKDGEMYYKIMLKRVGLFNMWYEEYGSYDKKDTDSKYMEIRKARNIIEA